MKLDLRPEFVIAALHQALEARKGVGKMLRVAEALSMGELLNHQGVHLEKLTDRTDPTTGKALYSLRVTKAARATAIIDGNTLVLLDVEPDHEKAYR